MKKPDNRQEVKQIVIDVLYYTVGSLSFALSVNCFSAPNRIAPGGLTGLATVIHYVIPGAPIGLTILLLNIPLLIGGAISWYVSTRSKDEALNNARNNRGTLIASGFIAGGALMGVVSAAMRFGGINLVNEGWLANPMSELVSLVAYALLIVYLIKASMNIQKK